MHVVLLGATGFVGSTIARRLAAANARVVALVRGSAERLQDARVIPVVGALPDVPAALFPAERFVLVHFATLQRGADAAALERVNVEGTRRVLAALPRTCAGVVYGSSLSVYGAGRQAGLREDAPVRPTTALARSRAAAEALVIEHGRAHGVPGVVLRPRFVVGEGDRFTLPGLLRTFLRGVAVGDEQQSFTIVDVEDYADVVVQLARRILDGGGEVPTGPLHVGYRRPVSLGEIRAALATRFPLPKPRHVPAAGALARILSAVPTAKTRALGTTLELVAHDHWVDVEAVARAGFADVVARDPREVLERAVRAMPGEVAR